MAWPDNTTPISDTQFQNDSGTVTGGTGARNELLGMIAKLNQALDSIEAGKDPWHTGNDGPLMKVLANGTPNDICLLEATGKPIRSGKTIATSVTATNNTVPTSNAVKAYVDTGLEGVGGYPKLISLTLSANGNVQIAFDATTGLMIQWGYDSRTGTGGTALTVNFNPDFSATPYSITGTEDKTGTVGNSMCIAGESATSYRAYRDNSTTGHWWIAIGPITGSF